LRQAAQALGVLRAQQGHALAGLAEDMTALRSLLPDSPACVRLVDSALTAATSAYVDELTTILASRATRDPLTGLPNRAALGEAMEHEVRATPRLSPPALLLIDLDGFKGVNDTDGHLAGDAVLKGVADLLRDQVRDGDLACRLGGDEFAVLLPRTSRPQATKVAKRILDASHVAAGLASRGARVHLSVGVGWLAAPTDADELVAVTDAAMYAAKATGGDAVRVGVPPAAGQR
jgi:diguanylate cyclase (GGDEF)-like protein